MMGLDEARGPRSCLHVNDPPETLNKVVSLFVQMTQYKNESDASIRSSYQMLIQLTDKKLRVGGS